MEHLLDAFFESNLVVQDGASHDSNDIQVELVVLVRVVQVGKLGPLGKSCEFLFEISDTAKYVLEQLDKMNRVQICDLRGG